VVKNPVKLMLLAVAVKMKRLTVKLIAPPLWKPNRRGFASIISLPSMM
jgi:hypothetical protein